MIHQVYERRNLNAVQSTEYRGASPSRRDQLIRTCLLQYFVQVREDKKMREAVAEMKCQTTLVAQRSRININPVPRPKTDLKLSTHSSCRAQLWRESQPPSHSCRRQTRTGQTRTRFAPSERPSDGVNCSLELPPLIHSGRFVKRRLEPPVRSRLHFSRSSSHPL